MPNDPKRQYTFEKNSAVATAVEVVDKLLVVKSHMSLKELCDNWDTAKEQYSSLKAFIEEKPRLFMLPQLVLFILERLQQDNLKLLLCAILIKVTEENHLNPRKKIEALKTTLSDEEKREIFDAYYDPIKCDYIETPVSIFGKHYNVSTWLKMMIEDAGIHVNSASASKSLQELKNEINILEKVETSGIHCVFQVTSEKDESPLLMLFLHQIISDTQHEPQEWQEFIQDITRKNSLTITTCPNGNALLRLMDSDIQERIRIGKATEKDKLSLGMAALVNTEVTDWKGDQQTLEKLLKDKGTVIMEPLMLRDFKYNGFTLLDPYKKIPIEPRSILAASVEYADTLDRLITQVENDSHPINRNAYRSSPSN